MEDAHFHRRTGMQPGRVVDGGLVALLAGFPVRAGTDGAAATAPGKVVYGTGIECGESSNFGMLSYYIGI